MSDRAPSKTGAADRRPNRGCRSFVRTGMFPRLACMRARWTALSLAAAVLLCGCRVPANAGVFVHIDSPVPSELEEILGRHNTHVGGRAVGWTETRGVCASPCDRWIDLPEDHRYVITGLFPDSPTFRPSDLTGRYDLTSAVTITVQPGSNRRFWAGSYTMLVGVLVFGPGASLLGVGTATGDGVMQKIGIGFMVPGGLTAIVGGVLMATASTKIKVQRTGEARFGDLAVLPAGCLLPSSPRGPRAASLKERAEDPPTTPPALWRCSLCVLWCVHDFTAGWTQAFEPVRGCRRAAHTPSTALRELRRPRYSKWSTQEHLPDRRQW